MNGEKNDLDGTPEDDVSDSASAEVEIEETDLVPGLAVDNVGDLSVEIDVEELVAKLESTDDGISEHEREVRRKLEEKRELKERELDSTYNINLDDDL